MSIVLPSPAIVPHQVNYLQKASYGFEINHLGKPQYFGWKKEGEVVMSNVKAQPEGYHTATPYLMVHHAAEAIEFYKRAFGAHEKYRMPGPGGKVMHAELQIGDSVIMLADETPEIKGPLTLGGSPTSLMLYVEDADKVFDRALQAGAKEVRPLKDQFYGDRSGGLVDPFGHQWVISTHIEDVSPEEMKKRMMEATPA
jgi:PhnB protein